MSEEKFSKLLEEWNSLKLSIYEREEIDKCFEQYIEKIKNDKFTLKDFAGPKNSQDCPYLTTFLEAKSRKIYGSARPGNMFNNGIYYSKDYPKTPYYISETIHGYKDIDKKEIFEIEKSNKKRIYFKEKIAQDKFKNIILPFLKNIVFSKDFNIYKQIEDTKYKIDNNKYDRSMGSTQLLRKIIAMNNAGIFLYIYSDDMINTLYRFFVEDQDKDISNIEKNKLIVEKLKEIGFTKRKDEKDEDYIINLSHFIWEKFDSSIDLNAKNIILHGAPGTGKTYMTDKSIKNNLSILNNQDIEKQYKLVQFHPSFGYEEFIDGIKPIKSKQSSNNIQLELVNGIFKDMCIDAFKELIRFAKLSKDKQKESPLKKFYFVADEINRAELSRVFGELLLCLEDEKRVSIIKDENGKLILKNESIVIKTQNASLWEKEHAVVIIKDGVIIDNINDITTEEEKDYKYYFGVPENLYFIGTMNDIDRSVDSFDMALRRRFVWKHHSYDEKVVEESYLNKMDTSEKLKNYLKNCKNLNNYITSDDGFNLSDSYELGQSYFMGLSSFSNTQLNKRWNEKIAPLLTEYLRVNFEGKDLLDQLKIAKEKFIPKEKKNDKNS